MATRDIILLRHAHAESATPGQDDAARALSARGESEADAAGRWLKDHGVVAPLALFSPAARARQTCERVRGALEVADARSDSRLYDATPAALIRVIEEHADAPSVLFVGHNPGLENLVALLTEGASDAGRGMPPAAVAWLTMPDGPIEPGTARVRHFWWP